MLVINKNIEIPQVNTAINYAVDCHESTNHQYDGKPYAFHLEMVYQYGLRYKHLLEPELVQNALYACWAHDVIEDCRQTYNDVKRALGKEVADIVYAVTQEKGKNRHERQNWQYYEGIKSNKAAHFVKICDRLANMAYSKENGGKMMLQYKAEYPTFRNELYTNEFSPMFREIEKIME